MNDMDTNQKAARAARRFLTERVRNDWDWPDVPDCSTVPDEEIRAVVEFRERYYGTSASEETEAEAEAGPVASPYKFDSPDSIGDAVEQKRENRKRKRRAAQNEEMSWNDGLSTFVQRRDAWTGAAATKKYGMEARDHVLPVDSDAPKSTSSDTLVSPPEASSETNDPADPLIPLAPRLLAGNPIRASIKPEAYGEIFNNIVVTNRSPSVPVNLADMTRALVYGWKELGEWPPKQGPLDPLAGRKRTAFAGMKSESGRDPFLAHHPHMKRGVDSVKRILHFNGHVQDNTATQKNV
jgi:hypothetical protein